MSQRGWLSLSNQELWNACPYEVEFVCFLMHRPCLTCRMQSALYNLRNFMPRLNIFAATWGVLRWSQKKNILINVVQPLGVICFFQYPSSWFPQGIGISMWTGRCKRHIYRMGFEFWGISENKTKIFLSTLRLQSHNDTTISNRERGKPNNDFIWCCSKESS